jgi:hypothetical protein
MQVTNHPVSSVLKTCQNGTAGSAKVHFNASQMLPLFGYLENPRTDALTSS